MVSRGKHNRFISLRTYKLTILRPRESGMGGGREAQEEGIYIHVHVCAKSLQLYLTLYIPMDCNPPCSSGQGILQARILEWVATTSSSWGSC